MAKVTTIFSFLSRARKAQKFLSPINLFFGKWKWTILVAIIAAVAIDHFYLVSQVNIKEAKIQVLEREKAACIANYNTISDALNNQNSLILMWAKAGKDQAASLKQLEARLTKKQNEASVILEKIKNEPTLNSCEAAIKYLYDASKELK